MPADIPSPLGSLRLRAERAEDRDFRFELFCNSRPPEWDLIDPALKQQLMPQQFQAQTVAYANNFPRARFDIIELGGVPVGRIVVNRPGTCVHIVDQAIVPHLRNRGLGTAVMRSLMDEAAAAGIAVRLKVASSNDPSMRLYLRLGFKQIDDTPLYLELEWNAPA